MALGAFTLPLRAGCIGFNVYLFPVGLAVSAFPGCFSFSFPFSVVFCLLGFCVFASCRFASFSGYLFLCVFHHTSSVCFRVFFLFLLGYIFRVFLLFFCLSESYRMFYGFFSAFFFECLSCGWLCVDWCSCGFCWLLSGLSGLTDVAGVCCFFWVFVRGC